MSNGSGRTGEEEKIILNGGTAGELLISNAGILEKTCGTIYSFTEDNHFKPADAKKLVVLANDLEDAAMEYQKAVFKFQRKVLEAVGFDGPWSKALL